MPMTCPARPFGASPSLQLRGLSVRGRRDGRGGPPRGRETYARIRWEPDPQIQQIISGWPRALHTPRAEALGFVADAGIDEVVQAFIEDDLEMQKQSV